jgi:protein-S-isoprenylcysteine O-methyltransferase Ste14
MIGRLVALYPRGWRERYGAEVAGLTGELVAAGQVSRLRAGLDLVAGAAAEWRRLAVSQVNLAPAAAAAAGVALVVHATAGGGARRPYFDSHPAGWLLGLAELAWLLTETAEFRRGRRLRRKLGLAAGRQRGFWPLAAASAAITTTAVYQAPPAFPAAAIRPGAASFAAGLLILLAGIALRAWSFRAMQGRYFSFTIAAGPGQPVVTSGPYRLLRHPGHAGFLLACAGIGLTTANWVAVAVLTMLPLAILAWRIRAEERALLAAAGERYSRYAVAHRRMIPLIW